MKLKIFTTIVLCCALTQFYGQIIHVPADQPTIQAGINAANNGDTVLVAEDTWFENINFKGKAITVASNFILNGDTSHISNTIIDGSQPMYPDSASVVYFISGEDTTSIIQGFTITGGKGTYLPPFIKGGGGILCYYSGAKILNNHIERDSIYNDQNGINIFGGGLYYFADNEWDDYLVIMNNKFRWNYLENTATGKYASGSAFNIACSAMITGNKVMYNVSKSNNTYASLYCRRSSTIQAQVTISNNTVSYNKSVSIGPNAKAFGSGIYINRLSGHVQNNLVEFNLCESEVNCWGAIVTKNTDTTLVIENNVIQHNGYLYAENCIGGGISLIWGTAKIINNLIYDNEATWGGGISIYDTVAYQAQIINNTIVQNSAEFGGGILNYGDNPIILNSIVYNNSAAMGSEILEVEGLATVNYSNIKNGWFGTGNIDEDPLFIGTGDHPFYLQDASLCVNTGIPDTTGLNLPEFDLDGNPRIYGGRIEMGAYENQNVIVGLDDEFNQNNIEFGVFPNPFSNQTTIEFTLPDAGFVTLSILDITGKRLETILSKKLTSGKHKTNWNAQRLPPGIYFLRLETNTGSIVQKAIILK
jgi:hypothetical protein